MPKLMFKPNREIAPAQLVGVLTQVMQRYLPLEFQHTRITPEEAWTVLAYASVNRQSLESACASLPGMPSGNRVREVLMPALPALATLQRRLNTGLRHQLHACLWKKRRPFQIALDVTLIPYHGQPHTDADEVRRGEAKAGTTHFHGYATVAIVHDHRRYTVALLFVRLGQTMAQVVRWLLDRVKRLKLRVRRVYLDAGFASVPVFRTLKRRKLAYVVPLPLRGKSGGVRTLFTRPKSYVGRYTLHSPEHGAWTVQVVVLRRYLKGRYQQHGVKWFAFAVAGLPRGVPCAHIFEWYRRRFSIETGYRQMHRLRARTTSRSPVLRLLLVGLALLLVNLYLTLRRAVSVPSASATSGPCPPLALDQLATAVRQAIEAVFGLQRPLRCRQAIIFS